MSATEAKPSWLDDMDADELEWAANYLSTRWPRSTRGMLLRADLNSLKKATLELELTGEGVRLVDRLRNAVRQRRYRSSNGGKKTCSFTLPTKTKTALKTLARTHRTTETMLVQRLIEGAKQQASEQSEAKHEARLEAKVTRNLNKLAQELSQLRIKEGQRHLLHCLEQLARWEIFFDATPSLSPEQESAAVAHAAEKMRVIEEVIAAAIAEHELKSSRAIGANRPART